jgi:hypothetical protein
MKRLPLIALMLVSIHVYSQVPPKKASKIIVLTSDTSTSQLDKIALELFNRRFSIDTRNDKLKYITTKERTNSNGAMLTRIRAIINDTSIIFTSEIALAMDLTIMGVTSKQTFDPVTFSGMKKSYMREAWNEMDAIARMFGDMIVYSK